MTHLTKFRKNVKQNIATVQLLEKLHKQDFRRALISGPISRDLVADTLLHMKLVSRTSCPWLIVGISRISNNVLCTAPRSHIGFCTHVPCWIPMPSFSAI